MCDVIEPGLKKWAVTRALFLLAGAVCSLKREYAEKSRQVVDVFSYTSLKCCLLSFSTCVYVFLYCSMR